MQNILEQIVEEKKREVDQLYRQYSLSNLKRDVSVGKRNFYEEMAHCREKERPFFIFEFKRKSPSEGWIARDADLSTQIQQYARWGARAISVLTDGPFFGGDYADLRQASASLADLGKKAPLLLQKDFVIDPIQVYLAREAGADMILLIAAILSPQQLQSLRETAESLGMGALVEVHDAKELEAIRHLDFPVLGVNNRDLKTFRTALNRVNVLARQSGDRYVVAESGVHDYRDMAIVGQADGFLIGTGLMRAQQDKPPFEAPHPGRLLKACGIRDADLLREETADWIGINFSPESRRRIDPDILPEKVPANAVAVFYRNGAEEIEHIIARYGFKWLQVYADDIDPQWVRQLRGYKVMLAGKVGPESDGHNILQFAPDVDLFILDGAMPGSGQIIDNENFLKSFPYPFLLAGGINSDRAKKVSSYPQCIGVDVASGIETDGRVDEKKIDRLKATLVNLSLSHRI